MSFSVRVRLLIEPEVSASCVPASLWFTDDLLAPASRLLESSEDRLEALVRVPPYSMERLSIANSVFTLSRIYSRASDLGTFIMFRLISFSVF